MRSFVRSSCTGFLIGAVMALAACGGDDTAPGPSNTAGSSSGGSTGNAGSNGGSGSLGSSGSASGAGGSSGSNAGSAGSGGSGQPDSGNGGSPNDGGTGAKDAAPDAAAVYNPCPAKGIPCAIMALGDSITDGAGGSGGSYRPALFKLALNKGQTITFVGNGMNGPNNVAGPDGGLVTFPKGHEGHSGFTIDDGGGRTGIHNLTAPAMNKYHPHIITLMIGTNDVNINLDLADAPRRLGGPPSDAGVPSLMDTIFTTDPNVLLVLAQMVPTTNDGTNIRVRAYNDAMPALVQRHIAAGHHILMVDMYGGFTANANYKTEYMNDELHPKDAGYVKMADIWYAAIGSLFR